MDLPSGSGLTDLAPEPPGPSTKKPAIVTPPPQPPSRYESQKRRDWNTFLHYLSIHKPPLTLSTCSGQHVIEFLKFLDQFGKTKVHVTGCLYFGQPNPPAACACRLKQAWGSLDALIGRLRAAYEENDAYEENGGKPDLNPFGARAVRVYLREVRESQAKARGILYGKKRKPAAAAVGTAEVVKVSVDVSAGGDNGGGGDGDSEAQSASTH